MCRPVVIFGPPSCEILATGMELTILLTSEPLPEILQ